MSAGTCYYTVTDQNGMQATLKIVVTTTTVTVNHEKRLPATQPAATPQPTPNPPPVAPPVAAPVVPPHAAPGVPVPHGMRPAGA